MVLVVLLVAKATMSIILFVLLALPTVLIVPLQFAPLVVAQLSISTIIYVTRLALLLQQLVQLHVLHAHRDVKFVLALQCVHLALVSIIYKLIMI